MFSVLIWVRGEPSMELVDQEKTGLIKTLGLMGY
jgi:hypothetical protein